MKKNCKALLIVLSMLLIAFSAFADDEIVDWEGKLEGEEKIPLWLKTMKRGNGLNYCQEFGLTNKINRKWFVPAAAESYISWEDGLIAAQANSFAAFGETIATDINASLDSSISNGSKSNIKRTVLSSLTTVMGMEYEGVYWYKVKRTTGSGKKAQSTYLYYVYAFYSMDMHNYDTQLKNALIAILKNGGLPQDEAQAVATASYEAVDARKRQSEDHEKKIVEEQKRVLQNHKLSMENRQMSMQEKGQDQQYDLDNRSLDTQQLKITETTKQAESRNKADVEKTRASANANDKAAMNANQTAPKASSGGEVSDALAFLYSLD